VLELGWKWLTESPGRELCQVWWELVHRLDSGGKQKPALEGSALKWLKEHGVNATSPEASRFVEGLLDIQCRAEAFLASAESWLTLAADKPSWPVIAAKYIASFPEASICAFLASQLEARINAVPNRRNWIKLEGLLRAAEQKGGSFPVMQRVLATLERRSSSPVWQNAEQQMQAGVPVEGRVLSAETTFATIELSIGLIGTWVYDEGCPPPPVGSTHSLYLCGIQRSGFVYVGPKPYSEAPDGNVKGVVRAHTDAALSIFFGQYAGRLHHSRCRNFAELSSAHPNGSLIDVVVLSRATKGLLLAEPGWEASPAITAVDLRVGDAVNGTVRSVVDYGIFVDIDGMGCLLHRSELLREEAFRDRFSKGDSVRAFVKKVKGDRIQLTEHAPRSDNLASTRAMELRIGQVLDGVVANVVDYGIFIELGGVTGLLHCSQLPKGTDNKKHFKKGDTLSIQVKAVEGTRISLTLPHSPARQPKLQYLKAVRKVGDSVSATVIGVTEFGVFFNLNPGIGLLHKSQIPGRRVSPEQFKPASTARVRIIKIEGKRISLTLTSASGRATPLSRS
jgi:predicted RNA-binding protein with RPS1 domain